MQMAQAATLASAKEEAHTAAKKRADELDAIVRKLTNDARDELLSASDGIRGLTLDDDNVYLDGVSLDGLSGAEQLKFAVEIARRANARSKILIVDALERLDPVQLTEFINHATSDGFQLICSRVDAGDLVLEAIEP
jgi:hypothetical protein